MMDLFEWAESRTNAMTIWDIGALKVYCVMLGMIVGAYMSGFIREHLWWFLLPVLFLGTGVGYRWLSAKPS
ncbi:MAG: hypothetical protein HKO65_05850 [Gemmatimonadetes bacterium]|nr:hypothetical protein [Gemmatimonadota bacterium]NNM04609.1 hypothetical protein [Gemmatimonadota bacterium]